VSGPLLGPGMMGQGGCMAIEDALVLVESLSTSDSVGGALDAYVTRRRPRVDWVQQQSRIVGQSVSRRACATGCCVSAGKRCSRSATRRC
jgi:2-polyprenyl-6-methoxyphenol hydroxylase-like FAD-dependent oxidoreductase